MKSEPVAIYEYVNVHGVAFEKGRFEPPVGDKFFRWRRKGTNGWPGGSSGAVIEEMRYTGADEIGPEGIVTGVEGEKTRLALKAAGFQAVTNAGGAKQTRFGTALEVLRGRDVVLWPDNDPDGQTWLRTLTAQLTPLVKSLRIVNWADAPPKGDAYDALAAGVDVGALIEEAVMSEEPVVGNLIPTFRRTDAGNVKLLAHLHHEDYVRGAGTADDERRPAVDHRVPDLARLLVAVVTGEENLALERRAQPFDLLVAERAGAAINVALAQ